RRLAEGAGGGRVGSGAASIELVRLLDREGRPVGRVRSGDPVSIEIVARAPETLADFVFGVEIATVSGATVFGTNTLLEGYRSERFAGDARIAVELPSLDLAPGVYAIDAAVHARDGAPYDYRRDVLRFEVTAERPGSGVWSPVRRWSFSGGVRGKG